MTPLPEPPAGPLRYLRDSLDAFHHAEDMLRAASTGEELRDRLKSTLGALLETKDIRLVEGTDPESRWAHDQSRTVVLPSESGGCQLVFPLVGERPERHFLVQTALSAESATIFVHQLLDRLVEVARSASQLLRERAEQVNARLLLDGVLDSVPLAILAADLSGKLILLNANAEVLFGLRRIDALDEPVEEAIAGAASAALKKLFDKVRETGRGDDCEIEHEVGGARINIGVAGTPLIPPSGVTCGVVFACRDLRLTRELQKLRELDGMKTEFVHTVSHELKTPLTAIVGSLSLLEMEKEKLSPDHRELVELIGNGARRLQALVTDILSHSQLERGKVELKIQAVPVVEAVKQLQMRLPREQRARIQVVGGAVSDAMAAADPFKLTQILENLVSNALKYSPDDKPVKLSIERDGEYLVIEVRDHGIGIRPADRKHISEKFFRSEDARLMGKEGTGLGLAIAYELTRLHGGKLTFDSEVGQGTVFTVQIPAWKETS